MAVGVHWFRRVCGVLGLDPQHEFRSWAAHTNPDALKGPFNHEARALVGMERNWYDTSLWTAEPPTAAMPPPRGQSLRDWEALRDRLASLVAQEAAATGD